MRSSRAAHKLLMSIVPLSRSRSKRGSKRGNPASHLGNADTREDALATLGLSVAAGLRDAGEKRSTRWLG